MIYEDKHSSMYPHGQNPQFHGRSKHIGIKYHYVCEQVKEGNVEIFYCPTEEMVADMLTKGLSVEKFLKFGAMTGIRALNERNVSASEKEC